MPKRAGPLTLCWLVTGWPSPPLLLGPGLLFRLVYVGRLKGEVHPGGLRIWEGYGGKGVPGQGWGGGSALRTLLSGKCFLTL